MSLGVIRTWNNVTYQCSGLFFPPDLNYLEFEQKKELSIFSPICTGILYYFGVYACLSSCWRFANFSLQLTILFSFVWFALSSLSSWDAFSEFSSTIGLQGYSRTSNFGFIVHCLFPHSIGSHELFFFYEVSPSSSISLLPSIILSLHTRPSGITLFKPSTPTDSFHPPLSFCNSMFVLSCYSAMQFWCSANGIWCLRGTFPLRIWQDFLVLIFLTVVFFRFFINVFFSPNY